MKCEIVMRSPDHIPNRMATHNACAHAKKNTRATLGKGLLKLVAREVKVPKQQVGRSTGSEWALSWGLLL